MITLPAYVRDQLRAIAAHQNLENLDQVTSAAEIAKKIICESLAETEMIDIDECGNHFTQQSE